MDVSIIGDNFFPTPSIPPPTGRGKQSPSPTGGRIGMGVIFFLRASLSCIQESSIVQLSGAYPKFCDQLGGPPREFRDALERRVMIILCCNFQGADTAPLMRLTAKQRAKPDCQEDDNRLTVQSLGVFRGVGGVPLNPEYNDGRHALGLGKVRWPAKLTCDVEFSILLTGFILLLD